MGNFDENYKEINQTAAQRQILTPLMGVSIVIGNAGTHIGHHKMRLNYSVFLRLKTHENR